MSVVLKHLRKYKPDWVIDVLVGRGKETIYAPGLVRRAYHYQEQHPSGPYERVLPIGFFENYCNFVDRPSYKVTNCLRDELGVPDYDPALGRYECQRRPAAMQKAREYLLSVGCKQREDGGKMNAVLVHYFGNTSGDRKNLDHWQADAVVRAAVKTGRVAVVLDWDNRCHLADGKSVFTPRCGEGDIWGGFGSGDAEVLACLIQQAEAFVGIDSGPGKVACTTDTPALICWKGHHPIQFEGPSPNAVHLVPKNHRALPPCCNQPLCATYFEKHYNHRTYEGDHGLVAVAVEWLGATLGSTEKLTVPVSYCLPNGIGDVMWALTKIRSVAGGEPIDVTLSGDPGREADHRAVPFLKRFPFVRSVRVSDVPVLLDKKDDPTDAQGRYRYHPDGLDGAYHYLVPNATLERGQRLEEWLPQFPTDYDVIREMSFEGTERGTLLAQGLHPFVAFYLGPEAGHCDEGHNRGWLWEPRHWQELGRALQEEHGLKVAVVGADYDRSFWEKYVRPGVEKEGLHWLDLIGKLEIGETFAFLKGAKALVSYQCGLAIVLHYLGGNVVVWWRPDGDSCHGSRKVCFDNNMRNAWVRPGWEKKYIGCLYKQETVGDILGAMEEREWLK